MSGVVGTAVLAGAVGAGLSWGVARIVGVDPGIAALVTGVVLVALVGGLGHQARRRAAGTGARQPPA